MNKHKSDKIKENSNTVRHLIMGQITTTHNLVAIKEVRHAGQQNKKNLCNIHSFVYITQATIWKISQQIKFTNLLIKDCDVVTAL